MSYTIDTIKYKGHTIELIQDEDAVRDLRGKQTCTPYDGRFTKAQQEALIDFLWSSLRPVPGLDQVQTGYDTKTKTGVLRVIESIVFPPTKKKGKSS